MLHMYWCVIDPFKFVKNVGLIGQINDNKVHHSRNWNMYMKYI
mgnify:FL=1